MRRFLLPLFTTMAVLVPIVSNAQVGSIQPTPAPTTSAASAEWYQRGEPIYFAGDMYFPTGPSIYFDGKTMTPSGTYNGVTLYGDGSRTPYSIVLVPIGGNLMRPYQKRPQAAESGTIGFLSPSVRVAREGQLTAAAANATSAGTLTITSGEPVVLAEAPATVGTTGTVVPAPASAVSRPERASVRSIPEPPPGSKGVWIEFEGARWYHMGNTVTFNPTQYIPVGSYHGFPVYREKNDRAASETIYVSVVSDGPLTPYVRR